MAQITWIHLGRGGVRGQGSPPCVGTARVHLLLPAGQGLRDLREQSGHSSAPPARPAPRRRPWGGPSTHLLSVVICRAPPRRLHRQHSCRDQTHG